MDHWNNKRELKEEGGSDYTRLSMLKIAFICDDYFVMNLISEEKYHEECERIFDTYM